MVSLDVMALNNSSSTHIFLALSIFCGKSRMFKDSNFVDHPGWHDLLNYPIIQIQLSLPILCLQLCLIISIKHTFFLSRKSLAKSKLTLKQCFCPERHS